MSSNPVNEALGEISREPKENQSSYQYNTSMKIQNFSYTKGWITAKNCTSEKEIL